MVVSVIHLHIRVEHWAPFDLQIQYYVNGMRPYPRKERAVNEELVGAWRYRDRFAECDEYVDEQIVDNLYEVGITFERM